MAVGATSTSLFAFAITAIGRRTIGNISLRTFAVAADTSTAMKNDKYYTVGITGASGLLGSSLIDELMKQDTLEGKPIRIVKFYRTEHKNTLVFDKAIKEERITSLPWNPEAAEESDSNNSNANVIIAPGTINQMDALVHLAGENVATGKGLFGFLGLRAWTEEKKASIMNSRVGPTTALAKAIAASKNPPTSFLVASGVGVYGTNYFADSSDEAAADESTDTTSTEGFLADVSRQWESAADVENARVVKCRMGVVLSKKGGALGKLYLPFWLGGGGIVGNGKQYFTFVSARDAARALVHTLRTPSLTGPVNYCAPNPCTNYDFTKALGRALSRPTIIPLPKFAVRLLFGEMGDEMLLGGVRAKPTKLEQSGFEFEHPTVDEACRSAIKESI